MEQLLDVSEQRSLVFLRALYSDERWWTEAELSTLGKCSSNTTYRTIGFLKEAKYSKHRKFRIISKKNKGFFLETTHSQHSMGEIESSFIKESLSYKLIHYIFQHKEISITQLATTLYVSVSTIYRKAHHLALYFEANGLSFNSNTFNLTGPEHLIREFFYRFYWYVIKSGEWPFDIVTRDEILTLYQHQIATASLKLNETEHLQLIYRLTINKIRHGHHHFLTSDPNQELLSFPLDSSTEAVKAFLHSAVPTEFLLTECRYLALIMETFPTYLDLNGNRNKKVSWHKKKKTDAYVFSTSILDSFKEMNPGLLIENETNLTYKFIAVYRYLTTFSKLVIRHSNITAFLTQTAKDHRLFFNQNQRIISQYSHLLVTDSPLDDDYLLYLSLLLFSSSLAISNIRKTLHIKLISMTEPLGNDYLKQKLISQFDYNFIIYSKEQQIPPYQDIDLILSDVQIEGLDESDKAKTYIWDFPPSERDWKNIYKFIHSIK